MMDFKQALTAYGADYNAIMERFMSNEAFYIKMIDMLFRDDNLEKMGAALAAGDLSSAFESAHTLKGVAGNMGLTPLYNAVCAIVEPLRAGQKRDDYSEMYQAIRDEFHKADELRAELKRGS